MSLYQTLEDKWYDFLDKINEKVPIYKIIDPIDKVIPSFILLLVLLVIILFLLLTLLFSSANFSKYDVSILVVSSKTDMPISGAKILINSNCAFDELEKVTDEVGKVNFEYCSNVFKINIQKDGFRNYSQEVVSESKQNIIKLSPINSSTSGDSFDDVGSKKISVTIIDEYDDILINANLETICDTKTSFIGKQTIYGFSTNFNSCSVTQFKASAVGYKEKIINWNRIDESVTIKLERDLQKASVTFITENISNGVKVEPNVEINLLDSKGEPKKIYTDSDGKIVVDLLLEEYNYVAYSNGEESSGKFLVDSVQSRDVRIIFKGSRDQNYLNSQKVFNLLIVTESDSPILNAKLDFYKDGNLFLSNRTTNSLGLLIYPPRVDSQYLSSSFFAVVSASGFEKKIVKVVPIDSNSPPTKIVLKQGENKLVVKVIDDTNAPVKDAIVKVISEEYNLEMDVVGSKITDRNGVYTLNNLPKGKYKIIASSKNSSGEIKTTMDNNKDTYVEVKLVLGEGYIRFNFFNENGVRVNPNFSVFIVDDNLSLKLLYTGYPKNSSYDTNRMIVGTKIKLIVNDENFYPTETPTFTITRVTQTKEMLLRSKENLPNNNELQLILENVYSSNPINSSSSTARNILPNRNYFLLFSLILDVNYSGVPLVGFFGGENNVALDLNSVTIESISSVDGSFSLLDSNMSGLFVNETSTTLVDDGAKIGVINLGQKVGKFSLPIILEIKTDTNTIKDKITYYAIMGDKNTLIYTFDFTIGKEFCLGPSNNCPPFLFSNFVEKNNILKPYEENMKLLVGENYKIHTSVENTSSNLYSNVDLVLSIPKEGIDNGLFVPDKNLVKYNLIALNPLSESETKIDEIQLIQSTSVWTINQKLEKIISGKDELSSLNNSSRQKMKFNVKKKDQLEITISPSLIHEKSEYPLFVVKTKFKGERTGSSALWRAEKILENGSLVQIATGATDVNGYEYTSFNAINLLKGDKVLFTAYDTNGSIDGNLTITISSGFPEAEVLAHECLSVKVGSINITSTPNHFVNLSKGASQNIVVDSNCSETRYVRVKTDLSVSELSFSVPANSNKTFTVTGNVRGEIYGAYPVQVLSINGSRYSQVGYFDIVVSDPNADFTLSKAIFDFTTETSQSGVITNNRYAGRKDNFYPKMYISTDSVSLEYNKPGNPKELTFSYSVIGNAYEAFSKGRTKSDKVMMANSDSVAGDCGLLAPIGAITALIYPNPTSVVAFVIGEVFSSRGNRTSMLVEIPEEIVDDSGITSAMQNWVKEVKAATPTPKPEPDLPETDPSKSFYDLPIEIQNKIVSTIISPEGSASNLGNSSNSTTTASTKEEKKYNKINLQETTTTSNSGSALINVSLPSGTNSPTGVIYPPTAVTNYKEVMTIDPIYGCLIGPNPPNKVYGKTFEFYYSNVHDIEGNPVGKFKIPGQSEYVMQNNSCLLVKRIEKFNYTFTRVKNDERALAVSYGFADRGDNGDCTGPRVYGKFNISADASCTPGSNNTDVSYVEIQTDQGDGGTYFFKRWKTWTTEVTIEPKEGEVIKLGRYEATPTPELMGVTSINDRKAGDSWNGEKEGNKSYFTVPILEPHGFVPPEFVLKNTEKKCAPKPGENPDEREEEKLAPANHPWVEYDSTGMIWYDLAPWTIPEGMRMFLKDGTVYGEYIGNIKVDWDPSGADQMIYIQTEPDIDSPNIDFTLTKIDLIGNEYAIITVQDWISGSVKKESAFQVKLIGPENTCFSSTGESGYSGENYVPKLLFKWDWVGVDEDACDSSNEGYTFCDGVQFNISLFKKLVNFNKDYIVKQKMDLLASKTTFYSYLIRDNFSSDLLNDFSYYFSNTVGSSDPVFYTNPGYKVFIDQGKISYRIRNSDGSFVSGTKIPYGGLYRVEIDIDLIDPTISSIFNGNNPNANIVVTLMPIEKVKNYNAFYETPFDGEIGKNESGAYDRADYGISFSNETLKINPVIKSKNYGEGMVKLNTVVNETLLNLKSGIVLKYNLENKDIRFYPSKPNPVTMKITNPNDGALTAKYVGENLPQNLINNWVLIDSSFKNKNESCLDFENNGGRVFTETISENNRLLSWSNAKSGNVNLATIIFAPKITNSPIKLVPNSQIITFGGESIGNKEVFITGGNNASEIENKYDNLEFIINQIKENKMCISQGGTTNTNVWWNPEYLAELIGSVSSKGNCSIDTYDTAIIKNNQINDSNSSTGNTPNSNNDLNRIDFIANFPGNVNSYIKVTNNSAVSDFSSGFSLEAKIKLTGKNSPNSENPTAPSTIISKGRIGEYWEYRFMVENSGTLALAFGSGGIIRTCSPVISQNRWHHVAVTINKSTKQAVFYVDGQAKNTCGSAEGFNFSMRSTPINIGRSDPLDWAWTGYHDPFKGQMNNVRIWNKTLNSSEIQKAMNNDINSISTALNANWTFNTHTRDESGKSNNGVAVGNITFTLVE